MIKRFIFLLIFIVVLFPINVNAASIKSTQISGNGSTKVGNEYFASFNVNFSGIEKGNTNSLGIFMLLYELDFDDSVFTITGVDSTEWDSTIYKEDGKYYILSVVGENDPYKNKCVDGILHCGDYKVTFKFFVNDTSKTNTEIKVSELEGAMLNMIDPDKEYTEDDFIIVEGVPSNIHKITINKSSNPVIQVPSNNVQTTKPNTDLNKIISKEKNKSVVKSNIQSNKSNINTKSSNNYIKKIEIENYELDFDKNNNSYKLYVDKGINQIKINVELEDKKASYKIIGAEDLASNKNRAKIVVTAEDGSTNTYVINVRENPLSDDSNKENKLIDKVVNEKNIKIGIGVLIGIILVGIVVAIISHVKNRKIDKALDDM